MNKGKILVVVKGQWFKDSKREGSKAKFITCTIIDKGIHKIHIKLKCAFRRVAVGVK